MSKEMLSETNTKPGFWKKLGWNLKKPFAVTKVAFTDRHTECVPKRFISKMVMTVTPATKIKGPMIPACMLECIEEAHGKYLSTLSCIVKTIYEGYYAYVTNQWDGAPNCAIDDSTIKPLRDEFIAKRFWTPEDDKRFDFLDLGYKTTDDVVMAADRIVCLYRNVLRTYDHWRPLFDDLIDPKDPRRSNDVKKCAQIIYDAFSQVLFTTQTVVTGIMIAVGVSEFVLPTLQKLEETK